MTLTRNDVPIGSIGGTARAASAARWTSRIRPRPAALVVRRQRPVRRRHRQRWRQRQHVEPGQRRQPGHASGPDHDPGPGALGPEAAVRRSLRQQRQRAAEPGRHRAHAVAGPPARQPGRAHARRTPDGPGRRRALFRRPAAKRRLSGLDTGRRQLEQVQGRRQRGEREPVVRRTLVGGDTETGRAGAWAARWAIWTAATRSPTARRAPRSTTRRPSSAAATSPPARQLRLMAGAATPGTTSTPSAMSRPAR